MASELVLVAAVAMNGVIGSGNKIPWDCKEDMQHFRKITTGHAIIMGRTTYDSIGRPLPSRHNIVVTRDTALAIPGCHVVHSLDAAIRLAHELGDQAPCVIGGAQIYAQALPLATELIITEMGQNYDGDLFMPPIDMSVFVEVERRAATTPGVEFVTLRRR